MSLALVRHPLSRRRPAPVAVSPSLRARMVAAVEAMRDERRGRVRVDPQPLGPWGGHAGPFAAAHLLLRRARREP